MSENRTIRFTQDASIELEAGVRWYEEQRRGLGSDFMLSVEASLGAIQRTPLMFPVIHRDVRRAMVKRFPYGLLFRVQTDSIDIISVFHFKRSPRSVCAK